MINLSHNSVYCCDGHTTNSCHFAFGSINLSVTFHLEVKRKKKSETSHEVTQCFPGNAEMAFFGLKQVLFLHVFKRSDINQFYLKVKLKAF